jgi:hypothetical protein
VADLDMTQYLRPGDTVLIGQAAAEPPTLVEKFIAVAAPQHRAALASARPPWG